MTELEQRNLILYFIELSERGGIIKNKYTEEKEKLKNKLEEVSKVLDSIGQNKLCCELEDAISYVIEATKHLNFEYGKIVNNIEEDYILDYEALD